MTHPKSRLEERSIPPSRSCAQTVLPLALACFLALGSQPANAFGSLAQVDIVDRSDGRVLPVYTQHGVHWIEGTPGHEYAVRVRNRSGGRVLAVMSVDGINVISGDTASPSQSGYVLDAYGSTEIGGWRKSYAHTAAFYFTELPDAYAARTGRPDNIGVIGVALFREKAQPIARERPWGKIAPAERDDSSSFPSSGEPRPAPSASGAAQSQSNAAADAKATGPDVGDAQAEGRADDAFKRREAARALAPQIGTGHGRIEDSRAERVAFERASLYPAETIVIRYDRRENLAALGILSPPVVAHRPDPFPGAVRFTPDPPSR